MTKYFESRWVCRKCGKANYNVLREVDELDVAMLHRDWCGCEDAGGAPDIRITDWAEGTIFVYDERLA